MMAKEPDKISNLDNFGKPISIGDIVIHRTQYPSEVEMKYTGIVLSLSGHDFQDDVMGQCARYDVRWFIHNRVADYPACYLVNLSGRKIK